MVQRAAIECMTNLVTCNTAIERLRGMEHMMDHGIMPWYGMTSCTMLSCYDVECHNYVLFVIQTHFVVLSCL